MVFTSYSNIISPLGFNTAENYEAIRKGKTGVQKTVLPFSKEPFCVAKINDAEFEKHLEQIRETSTHTRLEALSILSIQDVLKQSGIDPTNPRTLLIYSTTKGSIDILEGRYSSISPERAYLPALAKHLQSYFQFSNIPMVVSNACISGLLAIIIAKRLIEQGTYDDVIVCGGDILSEFTISGFKSFNAMSSEPSRPFDADRTGINLGEAVATLLITNKKELAAPYDTEIVSGASANDANHISGPSRTGEGLFQALQHTLKDQHIQDVGFISAHGTATPFNDEMESIAFERAGLSAIPLNSLKGYYGHTLGAAGVLETILSLEAMKQQELIRSEGYAKKGVSGNVTIIESHQPKAFHAFIKTASGFGGCNAAALFRRTFITT
jgi:3-oxoacyl-[acyl-carrier-protein] synthase-1